MLAVVSDRRPLRRSSWSKVELGCTLRATMGALFAESVLAGTTRDSESTPRRAFATSSTITTATTTSATTTHNGGRRLQRLSRCAGDYRAEACHLQAAQQSE